MLSYEMVCTNIKTAKNILEFTSLLLHTWTSGFCRNCIIYTTAHTHANECSVACNMFFILHYLPTIL